MLCSILDNCVYMFTQCLPQLEVSKVASELPPDC